LEYLHGLGPARPRTLFATHYHELTVLEDTLPRLRNLTVAVKEWQDEIVFLHKVERGRADKSYGIQVAKLAGLPKPVIERARVLLTEHEAMEQQLGHSTPAEPAAQIDLFTALERHVADLLRRSNPETMSPDVAQEFLLTLRRLL